MTQGTPSIATLLPIWVRGWALARGLPGPQTLADGAHYVKVGQPGQLARYVYSDHCEAAVAQRARAVTEPANWLKACIAGQELAPLLPPHWQMSDQRYFMRTDLADAAMRPLAQGYMLATTQAGLMTTAHITTAGGAMACSGNVILLGHHAVFDQIGTAPEHQRKGLGQVLMLALAERARAQGANQGLLVATEQGQHLYRTLDWQTVSPYSSAWIANTPH